MRLTNKVTRVFGALLLALSFLFAPQRTQAQSCPFGTVCESIASYYESSCTTYNCSYSPGSSCQRTNYKCCCVPCNENETCCVYDTAWHCTPVAFKHYNVTVGECVSSCSPTSDV